MSRQLSRANRISSDQDEEPINIQPGFPAQEPLSIRPFHPTQQKSTSHFVPFLSNGFAHNQLTPNPRWAGVGVIRLATKGEGKISRGVEAEGFGQVLRVQWPEGYFDRPQPG